MGCFEDTTVHRYLEECSAEDKEKVVALGTLVVDTLVVLEESLAALELLEAAQWSPEVVLAALELLEAALRSLEAVLAALKLLGEPPVVLESPAAH